MKGRWKSTTDLSMVTDLGTSEEVTQAIEIYFDFDGTSQGLISYHALEDGGQCKANVTVDVKNNSLAIDQYNKANCYGVEQTDHMNPYTFTCEASPNGTAVCDAISKDDNKEIIQFNLVKVEEF